MKNSYILGKNIRDAVLSAKHSVTESLRNVKESAQDLVAGLKGQAPSSEETKIQETKSKETEFEILDAIEGPILREKAKSNPTLRILTELAITIACFYIHPIFGLIYMLFLSAALFIGYAITVNKNNQTTS